MKNLIVVFLLMFSLKTGTEAKNFKPVFADYCPDAIKYTSLEEALKEPEKVIKLDISMLKLTAVPPEIGKLVNLECLDVSFNRISTLPVEIANCKKLRFIDLSGTNYMSKLPQVLTQLPNLEAINISDHKFWKPAQFDEAQKLLPKVKMILENEIQY
ncbi:MAG: leucine-rich repeat domain-containing protein [Cytophagaceae bacterium]